jgi:hypothetical protein
VLRTFQVAKVRFCDPFHPTWQPGDRTSRFPRLATSPGKIATFGCL